MQLTRLGATGCVRVGCVGRDSGPQPARVDLPDCRLKPGEDEAWVGRAPAIGN